ncbi:MAG: TerC family protein [Candidatus Devosia phytovorans]|uniref:TerC family protein n=1 Tax=Candidatus Devosia phytovorans TaxID=3121372 RepID=A0AAJ5W0N5_9HYPH|nr:TerC family protein [Devosia sp.]WEK06857.1 MAG: TerC family protein [Devosia sp.]
MSDPAAWAGLGTLILLEIVLGIDNLVFIAILADKLPEHQRNRARVIGLSLALVMRLGLLASVAWIVTLTAPLFTLLTMDFSGRDLILILGGLFLLAKGTMELHERLEGHATATTGKVVHAVFWQVLVQIVVLDAVFSLDSVITAVGMVDELSIMMIAVIVAVATMLALSKPLMAFVSKHPTVVILCLGFLLMIGFSLVVEGFGYHMPKGYLYAAIGFSIAIEACNQIARRNREKALRSSALREKTADAVLRMLGGRRGDASLGETADVIAEQAEANALFAEEEKDMVRGVLDLGDRTVMSIMTPRREIDWLDLEDDVQALQDKILDLGHSRFLLGRGSLDELAGVALAKDLLRDIIVSRAIDLDGSVQAPMIVHESATALKLIERLRENPVQMAVIVDEYGVLQGIATPMDVLEAIAGEFPDADDPLPRIERQDDGRWLIDGDADIRLVSVALGVDLVDEADRYATLAGYLLYETGDLPAQGASITIGDMTFTVAMLEGSQITTIEARVAEAAVA